MWWEIGGVVIVLVLVWLACHPGNSRSNATSKLQ